MPSRGGRARHVTFVDAYGHVYAGAQRSLHLLAQHLPEHGYTADVVLTSDGPFADALRASDVETTIITVGRSLGHYGGSTTGWRVATAAAAMPRFWRSLSRHLRPRRGVVHACSQRSVLLAAPAARLTGAAFVWQVSAVEEHRVVSRACDLLAHRTIGISRAVAVPSLRPWRQQTTIPMPIDPHFEETAPNQPGDRALVVTVGRLEPIKSVDVLLEATARVRERVPDVRLLVLGGEQLGYESHAAQLYALRDRLGLTDAVEFAGAVGNIEESWRGARVYVQASRLEGQGIAALEAMACGIPTVITSSMGIADDVVDGDSALVVPPGDADALASAIEGVLTDGQLAERLACGGRAIAQTRFSVDEVCARLVQVYDSVL